MELKRSSHAGTKPGRRVGTIAKGFGIAHSIVNCGCAVRIFVLSQDSGPTRALVTRHSRLRTLRNTARIGVVECGTRFWTSRAERISAPPVLSGGFLSLPLRPLLTSSVPQKCGLAAPKCLVHCRKNQRKYAGFASKSSFNLLPSPTFFIGPDFFAKNAVSLYGRFKSFAGAIRGFPCPESSGEAVANAKSI